MQPRFFEYGGGDAELALAAVDHPHVGVRHFALGDARGAARERIFHCAVVVAIAHRFDVHAAILTRLGATAIEHHAARALLRFQ